MANARQNRTGNTATAAKSPRAGTGCAQPRGGGSSDRLCRFAGGAGNFRRGVAPLARRAGATGRTWRGKATSIPATPILTWTGVAALRWILAPLALVWVLAVGQQRGPGRLRIFRRSAGAQYRASESGKEVGADVFPGRAGAGCASRWSRSRFCSTWESPSWLAIGSCCWVPDSCRPAGLASSPSIAPSKSAGSRHWCCCCGRASITCCSGRSWRATCG